MADLSNDEIEIRAIKEAYDALKCLDDAGRSRALTWLYSRFAQEELEGREARRTAVRKENAHSAHEGQS